MPQTDTTRGITNKKYQYALESEQAKNKQKHATNEKTKSTQRCRINANFISIQL